jgi:hypothetical protein
MTWTSVILLAAAAWIAYGIASHYTGRLQKHGLHAIVWRWMTGMPHHGKPLTNRGWLRKGTPPAHTASGHATRLHFLPRWQHTLIRSAPTLAVLAVIYGWFADRAVTEGWLTIAVIGGTYWLGWRALRAFRQREHHQQWMTPLHMRLAPMLDIPSVNKPESWLEISAARDFVKVALPQSFHPDAKDKERIQDIVATTVGMHANCEPHWDKLTGPEPYVTFTRSVPAPDLVTLEDLRPHIVAAGPDEIVLGIGRDGKVVKVSLASDSPHIGLSMPTGDGKSVIVQLILAQVLFRGGIGLILDNKLFSHPWALYAMPNVRYAGTPEQIHNALLWLGGQIEQRKQDAFEGIDLQGRIRVSVGPRAMIVGEELNVTTAKLRKYWKASGGGGPSPALEVLDEVAFIGRQLKIHALMVAQLLTARATGSTANDSSVRENCGVRMLGGNSSAAAWKMLAPEVTMPPKTLHPGRVQVVTRRGVEECQIAYLNPLGRSNTPEARMLALDGAVTRVPEDMPLGLAKRPPGSTGTREIENAPADLCRSTAIPMDGPAAVNRPEPVRGTLRQAAGTVVPYTLSTLRTYRHDDPAFPEPAGHEGTAEVFDFAALREYAAARRERA